MHDELIDYLSNNTNLARFSRGEIRALLERLDADGYELVRKAHADLPPPAEPPPNYELQGNGYDSGASGYELAGRKTAPDAD